MMRKVVIDTNVVVSSNLTLRGNPAEIMKLFYTGTLQLFYSDGILNEYKRVLAYERLNIAMGTQEDIIKAIEVGGVKIAPPASTIPMIDETDRVFYDTANLVTQYL